jgi:hypothetical protein
VKLRRFTLVLAVAGLAAVAAAPGAYAETRKCTGAFNGTVKFDNIKVPKGATCTLNGTRVKGNIKVGRDATLIASNVKIGGNIQSQGFALVRVNGMSSKVGGSIQLKDGDVATLTNVKVNGDIQLFDNYDALTLNGNKIGGNLQCKENFDDPTGANNKVKGNAEDQCEGIAIEV